MKVTFNLQEGFKDDTVIISNKNKKFFEADDVSTRTQIGLAKSFETEVSNGKIKVKVLIPTRDIEEEKEIDLTANSHIGISIADGEKLEWKMSEMPFMYM
jgi:hypothetical protein